MDVTTLDTTYTFPSDFIDPADKDAKWHLEWLRAMYTEATTRQYAKIFAAARDDYKRFKDYALSMQSSLPYRKWLTGAESLDKTWTNINWAIPTIATKYRNILVNKILGRQYNIVCTPIDPLAVDETNKWFSDLKAKTKMREVAARVAPDLLQTSALQRRGDEPENMEDFNMRSQLGFRTFQAMEAEIGIQVIWEKAELEEERKMVVEDLVDLGVGIYRREVDENDEVSIKRTYPLSFGCSYCRRPDFKDMTWGYEGEWVKLSELVDYFTAAQLEEIADKVAGKNGNPRSVPFNFSLGDYDKFKVLVIYGAWFSIDVDTYKRGYDTRGNYFVKRKKLSKRDANATVTVEGQEKPMYKTDGVQSVYKGRWIVDTNFVYDWGRMTDQPRKKGSWKKTQLPWHVYAPDFHEMKALGIMERMIPFVDDYCNTWFKIQNFKNRWIPYIIKLDIAALENIPLGKGGKKLTPKEVLQMLFDTHILVTRQKNALSGMQEQNNPVTVETTNMATELIGLVQQLENAIQNIRDVTGINEALDASSPADRTNVLAQQQAEQGSNNAIKHFADADSKLLCKLADSSLMLLQQVLKRGKKVSGYIHALGTDYLKFVQVSPTLPLHEYAIKIEDRPDMDIKQMLIQQLAIADQNGRIQPEDFFMIMNMTNLKEMEMKFIYQIKKRQKEEDARADQRSHVQSQSALQVAQATEQAKQDSIHAKGEEDRKTADVVGAWGVEQQKAKGGAQLDAASLQALQAIFIEALQQFHQNGQGFGAAGALGGQGQQSNPVGQGAPPSPAQPAPAATAMPGQ